MPHDLGSSDTWRYTSAIQEKEVMSYGYDYGYEYCHATTLVVWQHTSRISRDPVETQRGTTSLLEAQRRQAQRGLLHGVEHIDAHIGVLLENGSMHLGQLGSPRLVGAVGELDLF